MEWFLADLIPKFQFVKLQKLSGLFQNLQKITQINMLPKLHIIKYLKNMR